MIFLSTTSARYTALMDNTKDNIFMAKYAITLKIYSISVNYFVIFVLKIEAKIEFSACCFNTYINICQRTCIACFPKVQLINSRLIYHLMNYSAFKLHLIESMQSCVFDV